MIRSLWEEARENVQFSSFWWRLLIYNLLFERYLMSTDQSTMKWGDIIRIHGVSTTSSENTKGLIISKGLKSFNADLRIQMFTIKPTKNMMRSTSTASHYFKSFLNATLIFMINFLMKKIKSNFCLTKRTAKRSSQRACKRWNYESWKCSS